MKSERMAQQLWPSVVLLLLGCGGVTLVTVLAFPLQASSAAAGFLYLLVVVFIALSGRIMPALIVSAISVCAWDYYFTPPIYHLTIWDPEDLCAYLCFITTGLVVTRLTGRIRKSLAQIQLLREELRLTIDNIPIMIWSVLPDGVVDFANRRWMEYTGVSLDQARKEGWGTAVHPEDKARLVEWRTYLKAGQPFENEFRLRRADGEYRWLMNRAFPLRNEQGEIVKWYGTSVDIEDRKRAERLVSEMREQLAHVSRVTALGELAVSIAHEVNQPLTAIVNNANACLGLLLTSEPWSLVN